MEQFAGVDLEDIDEEEYERLQMALLESMQNEEIHQIDAEEAEEMGLVQDQDDKPTGTGNEEEKKQ